MIKAIIKKKLANKEIKNAGWLIGGRIFQMLLSLVVGVLTARFLGPQNFGVINYAAAFTSLFGKGFGFRRRVGYKLCHQKSPVIFPSSVTSMYRAPLGVVFTPDTCEVGMFHSDVT